MLDRNLPVLLSFLLLAACSAAPGTRPIPSPSAQAATSADITPAWRICWFRSTWPEGEEPRWEIDLLLAHHLLGPIIAEHEGEMESWRFHRRAVRDNAGHQFRFLFYGDSSHAAEIIRQIEESPLREQLLENSVLESATCQNPNNMSMPDIADTSDPNWPETIQKNWPAYIMGISKFWLGLIDDATAEIGTEEKDIDELLEAYKQANRDVTSLWQTEGEHALLHHLNAIFGYQPLQIRF